MHKARIIKRAETVSLGTVSALNWLISNRPLAKDFAFLRSGFLESLILAGRCSKSEIKLEIKLEIESEIMAPQLV